MLGLTGARPLAVSGRARFGITMVSFAGSVGVVGLASRRVAARLLIDRADGLVDDGVVGSVAIVSRFGGIGGLSFAVVFSGRGEMMAGAGAGSIFLMGSVVAGAGSGAFFSACTVSLGGLMPGTKAVRCRYA